jgi:hypothetical protein
MPAQKRCAREIGGAVSGALTACAVRLEGSFPADNVELPLGERGLKKHRKNRGRRSNEPEIFLKPESGSCSERWRFPLLDAACHWLAGGSPLVQAVIFCNRAIRSSMGGCVENRWPGLPEIFNV